jgi:transposase
MNMRWLLIEITETVEELKAIMHSKAKAKLKERVHALYVWKAGIVKEIADLAGLLGRSESTILLWFARYQAEGLSGLLAWNYRGGKRPALAGAVLEALQRTGWISELWRDTGLVGERTRSGHSI